MPSFHLTALHFACDSRNDELVKYLISLPEVDKKAKDISSLARMQFFFHFFHQVKLTKLKTFMSKDYLSNNSIFSMQIWQHQAC